MSISVLIISYFLISVAIIFVFIPLAGRDVVHQNKANLFLASLVSSEVEQMWKIMVFNFLSDRSTMSLQGWL